MFCLFKGSVDQFNDFVTYLSIMVGLHTIKFNAVIGSKSVSFLDTVVHPAGGGASSDDALHKTH